MRYTSRMANFKVQVSKDYLVFCAAHFVTYDGVSEPLHGHNYRASVTVEGTLQEDHFVFNFVTLKRIMHGLVDQLDHLTLLPEFNPYFHLTRANGARRRLDCGARERGTNDRATREGGGYSAPEASGRQCGLA